jgi:hypothetical protein
MDRRLGGPQRWSRHGGEEKNSQPLPGIESPIIQSVVQGYTTELSRLLEILVMDILFPQFPLSVFIYLLIYF